MKALILLFSLLSGVAHAQYTPYPGYGDKHWKAPVANSAALPATGNLSGDTRIVLSPASVYDWSGSAWIAVVPANVISGPGSATTDKALSRWNGTTGLSIQNSSATLSDAGLLSCTNVSTGNITSTSQTINGNADVVQVAVRRQSGVQTSNIEEWQTELNAALASVSPTGVMTAAGFVGPLTGNASTSTALAATPSGCAANSYAISIAASGNLGCSTVSDAGLATSYLKADGSRALTANWNAGAFSGTFNSVAVGSALNTVSGVSTLVNGAGTLTLPSSTDTLVGRATTDTLTNKSIDAATNTISNLADANVKVGAAITRTKLATGTANHVLINDGTGAISSEAQLASTRGGTGVSNAGTLTYGANNVAFSTTAATSVTLPTSGTLLADPTTTKGDLLVNNGSAVTRFSVCPDGQAPVADSTQTTGWKCGATGSGSGINYISNGTFESSASGWTTYADGAATPVDGTGGAPTLTITRSTTSPLRGTASGLITSGALGNGAAYAFTIDAADEGHQEQIQADYVTASGTIADGDYTVWIYDVTNAVLIQAVPYLIYAAPSVPGHFAGTFQAASNSTSYRLLIHQAVSSTGNLRIDNVSVGPQILTQGPPVTDWASCATNWSTSGSSPSVGNGTLNCQHRRVGDSDQIHISLIAGSTTSFGVGTQYFSVPTGETIDTTKLPTGVSNPWMGLGNYVGAHTNFYHGDVAYHSTTTVGVVFQNDATQLTDAHPVAWASGDDFDLMFTVPILGWSSGLTMSSAQGNARASAIVRRTTAQSLSTSGADTVIQFDTIDTDTAGMCSASTFKCTAPSSGFYRICDSNFYAASATGVISAEYRVNGGSVVTMGQGPNTSAASTVENGCAVKNLSAGDYIEFMANQTSGGALNLNGATMSFSKEQSPQQLSASDTVAARASGSTTAIASSATTDLINPTKTWDSSGAYNSTTGIFSPFPAGKYEVKACFTGTWAAAASNFIYLVLKKNGTTYSTFAKTWQTNSSSSAVVCGSDMVNLNSGDTANVALGNSLTQTVTADGSAGNFVSFTRVGN